MISPKGHMRFDFLIRESMMIETPRAPDVASQVSRFPPENARKSDGVVAPAALRKFYHRCNNYIPSSICVSSGARTSQTGIQRTCYMLFNIYC